MDTESLIAHAQRVAEDQGLENEAREALARWLSQPEELPRGLRASDIAASFQRCALVFRNADLPRVYFETKLRLLVSGKEIGTYRLITDTAGNPEDDYLEWAHEL